MASIKFSLLCAIITFPAARTLSLNLRYFDEITFPNYTSNGIDQRTLEAINSNISKLAVKHSAIKKIERNSFTRFRKLKELAIHGDNLAFLQHGAFNGLNQLEELWIIIGLKLTMLNRTIFRELENLVRLNLWGNGLTHLELGTFNGLGNVDYLDLSDNKLEYLEPRIFDELVKLEELDLTGNNLKYLDPRVFGPLDDDDEYFKNCSDSTNILSSLRTSLTSIRIENNNITKIGNKTFHGMELATIDLQRNRISEIEPGAFSALAVDELFLNDNQLTSIEAGVFDGIIFIRDLDISRNPIYKIGNNALLQVRPLEQFYHSFTDYDISVNGSLWGLPTQSEFLEQETDKYGGDSENSGDGEPRKESLTAAIIDYRTETKISGGGKGKLSN